MSALKKFSPSGSFSTQPFRHRLYPNSTEVQSVGIPARQNCRVPGLKSVTVKLTGLTQQKHFVVAGIEKPVSQLLRKFETAKPVAIIPVLVQSTGIMEK
jgi:hypothetical protein